MKKNSLALAVLSLSILAGSVLAAEPMMKICHENEDSYPWIFKDRVGLPWKRCLEDARSGAIDGVVKISFAADRTEFLVYPMMGGKPDANKRLLHDSYSLYRMKGSTAATWDGKTLRVDGAVGAQSGFSVVKQLQGLGARVDDGTRSADANLTKLVFGRLVAVALQTEEGDISVANNPQAKDKVERVSPVLVEKPYFVAFSKQFYGKEEAAAKKLWDAIATARESAEYKDLVKSFK